MESESKGFISEWQTSEQIIIPMLCCIGWPIMSKHGVRLIRTGASKDFDLLYLKLECHEIYMGVECKNFTTRRSEKKIVDSKKSPSNDSFSEQIIRYLEEGNIKKRGECKFEKNAKFVWTNGREWVVFKKAAMERSEEEEERKKLSRLFSGDEIPGYEYEDYFEYFEFLKDNEEAWDEQFEKLARELVPIWGNINS
jgi:hypothetical protein